MSTSMSWMALFFEDKGLILWGLPRVAGGNAPDWRGFPGSSRGKEPRGKGRSGPLTRAEAQHSGEKLQGREWSRRGKNLPAGVGRDNTQPSLKVILPDTCASTSLLPPLRVHLPAA